MARSLFCTSSQVRRPSVSSFAAETLPTPGIFASGSVFRKAGTSSGVITYWPLGLLRSEAILARNLTGATPAEAVSCSSLKMLWRISWAIRVAEPWQCTLSVTSRKASSSERGSMREV